MDRKNSDIAMEAGTAQMPRINGKRSRRNPGVLATPTSTQPTHQIESNEKPSRLIRRRISKECRACSSSLRDNGARAIRKPNCKSMSENPLLNAKGIRRAMNPEVSAVDERWNDLCYHC